VRRQSDRDLRARVSTWPPDLDPDPDHYPYPSKNDVYRNLTGRERAEIDAQYGPVDWAQFGPASDEDDGLTFIEEVCYQPKVKN